jgi:signal transduction histidine kinase
VEEHENESLQEIPVPRDLIEQVLIEANETAEHLQTARKQLVLSEKMATLGQLIAGIAHEINTPVASINSNTDLFNRTFDRMKELLKAENMPEGVRKNRRLMRAFDTLEKLNKINATACDRIVPIVRSLRSFAHVDEMELQKTDIHEGLETSLVLVHHEIKNRIEVVREYGDIPECNCCLGRLNSVFINILVNAAQAIEGKGKIFIKTFQEGDTIKVQFTDTGKGIPPENLEKIFEDGFTTKPRGEGTGLGLAICHRIIEEHRGKIEVESEVGRGTTFTITLPIERPKTVTEKQGS